MQPPRRPITDSPWFWAYLFATAGLVGLALIGPKFSARQSNIEREFQGRQRAAQNVAGQTPTVELSTTERTLLTLRPLFLALAAVTIAAWLIFWRNHSGQSPATPHSSPDPQLPTPDSLLPP